MNRTIIARLAAVLVVTACGRKEPAPQQAAPGMGNMPGMPGLQVMAMRADSMMPMMRAHLDSLAAGSPKSAAAMIASHEAMASQMLDAMGADMTAMGMKPAPTWMALTDSIKRDLADLPGLSGRALDQRLKSHVERMRRLMAMHEGMMRGMKKST